MKTPGIVYLMAAGGVLIVVVFYFFLWKEVNHTTVALSFLLVVLISSTRGIGPGVVASVLGMLSLNLFFLPPVGTFHIEDSQNWVALAVFLFTAIIASHLSATARGQALRSEERRQGLENLYQLSRSILAVADAEQAITSLAEKILASFQVSYCAVFLVNKRNELEEISRSPEGREIALLKIRDEQLRNTLENGHTEIIPTKNASATARQLGASAK